MNFYRKSINNYEYNRIFINMFIRQQTCHGGGGGLPPPIDWGTARSALSDGGPGQLWGAVARRPLVPPMENAPRQTECDPTGRARRGTAR